MHWRRWRNSVPQLPERPEDVFPQKVVEERTPNAKLFVTNQQAEDEDLRIGNLWGAIETIAAVMRMK